MTAAEREELKQLRLLQAEILELADKMPQRILELCQIGGEDGGFAADVQFVLAHPHVVAITSAVLLDDGQGKHVTVCGPLAEVVRDMAGFLRTREVRARDRGV